MTLHYRLLLPLVALIGVFLTIMLITHPRGLRLYWQRSCTGRDWKRTFPQSSKQDIRRFLYMFVDGFAFPRTRALQFAPTDRVLNIYRSVYPVKDWPDALELETFARFLETQYRINLRDIWREDLTLGEIFSKTMAA
jgi:propanediol dehydratase small subunit